ncbi:MAG: hypothetical protein V4671_11245 [Armatimonadota bacterium]
MKPIPLQMQQNLILVATLFAGILFAPQNIATTFSEKEARRHSLAPMAEAVSTAVSYAARPASGAAVRSPENTTARNVPKTPRRTTPKAAASVPLALQGEWVWDSAYGGATANEINEVTFSRFNFRPDGRYSFVYSVRQQFHGKSIESVTTEEGTAAFYDNGTFVMHPTEGHFQGNTEGGFVSRPMETVELGERTLYWGWREENDNRSLYLGPSKKSAALYTPAAQA